MFGFGMSPKDKAILAHTERLLAGFLLPGDDVRPLARELFDKAKAEAKGVYGDDMYSESYGDMMLANNVLMKKRLDAGLTVADVHRYWSRPVFVGFIEAKVTELVDFVALDAAHKAGKDLVEVTRDRRRREPRYGDPEKWNPSLPVNSVFSMEDADIYPEFAERVSLWQSKIPATEQTALLKQFTSFNALVRDLVRKGKI